MIEVNNLVKGTSDLARTNMRVLNDAAELAMRAIKKAFPDMVESADNESIVQDIVCSTLNRTIKKH